jgi:hypothetical protein
MPLTEPEYPEIYNLLSLIQNLESFLGSLKVEGNVKGLKKT